MSLFVALSIAAAATPISAPITAGVRGELAGTLMTPSARSVATALIIPGSGPTDRDGNNPLGVTAAPYRMLAEALAAEGIATVRIDKRGMFGSKAGGDPNAASIAGYAADTASWVGSARRATGAKCVWLIGHSEGGLVALASANGPDLCGLILLEAPGRKLGVTIRNQLRANPANAPMLPQAEAALAALEAGGHVDVAAMHPALAQGLFNPAVQDFLIDLLRQEPAALARDTRLPLLIVRGEHDLQISAADAEALHAANPAAQLTVVPAMNHVLKLAPRDRAANLATYGDPSLPLAPGVVTAIATFIRAHAR